MKLLICYGTRPEYIKIKPLFKELDKNKMSYDVLFTGQHENIAKFKYDYKLDIINGKNRLDSIVQSILNQDIFDNYDYVLVQGDTTTVFSIALTCFHKGIKVIHLEAGLRTGDIESPYPEEFNRQCVSKIASINLCPAVSNKNNLLSEGVSNDKIFVVGNTVLDNLIKYKSKIDYKNYVLVTIHRRENHKKLKNIFKRISKLSEKYENIKFVIPLHPNPNVQKNKKYLTNIEIIPPLDYDKLLEFVSSKCLCIITDSGGIQEEALFLKKRCIVMRDTTERQEGIYDSGNVLCPNLSDLESIFSNMIKNPESKGCPFGDGKSSKRIVDLLKLL